MSTWKENSSKIILLDNGSYEIKHSKPTLKKIINFIMQSFSINHLGHHFLPQRLFLFKIYPKIIQKKIFPQ
jgi:hypothetical protein